MHKFLKIFPWLLSAVLALILIGIAALYFYTHTGPITQDNIFFGRYADSLTTDLATFDVYDTFEETGNAIRFGYLEIPFPFDPFDRTNRTVRLTWSYSTTSSLADEIERFRPVFENYCTALEPIMQQAGSDTGAAELLVTQRDDHFAVMSCRPENGYTNGFTVFWREPKPELETRNRGYEIEINSDLRVN